MSLVYKQVTGRSQEAGCLASPCRQVGQPDQGALAGVDEIGPRAVQRYPWNRADDVPAGHADLVRPTLRAANGDLAESEGG
jgi:hypothetical protein